MRILGAIVQISALAMFNPGKQSALRHAVAPQLIGHNHARDILQAFQQPSEETRCGPGISPGLNEDVEHDTVLVHRAPKIMLDALDPNEHLIEMPLVTGPRTTAAQAVGKAFAKFLAPTSNGLIGDDNVPLSQQQLNISKAESEQMVQPNGMADDLGRETVAVVRVWRGFHAGSLAGLNAASQTGLP
jgi:hypothetical protein